MQVKDSKARLIISLGEIVEHKRKEKGKSIYLISAECGLPKSTWRELEAGVVQNVTLTTLWKIADGLEIPLENLITELKEQLGEDFSLNE